MIANEPSKRLATKIWACVPLLFCALSALTLADEPKPTAEAIEFFESKVRPILVNQCLGCHGPEKQKAGLRLDSRPAMIEGGDSGAVIRPGDPDKSRLVEVVRYGSDIQMPPKRKLSDAEIAAITAWVRSGAHWPEAAKAAPAPATERSAFKISAEQRAYWAFQPIRRFQPPAVSDSAWPLALIDHFVLAKLEEKGLRPGSPADKRTMIRRATFDVIGLPPTVEEIDAFLADHSAEAFDRVVDRLLASPRYGERWGRHWLDVARYGEDQAHTFEARLYPYGYRYRDWVVKALNDDLPYDRFLIDQIAGDLIDGPGRDDRLAATGLFSLGPVYYGRAVYDELDDRVDTLTRGFLGMTVACARCHDHKFDPISQRDYYALAGIFFSTKYQEYPKARPEAIADYDKGQAAIKSQTDEIAAFVRTEGVRLAEAEASRSAEYMTAAWTLFNRRKVEKKLPAAAVAKAGSLDAAVLEKWMKYLFGDDAKKRPHLARWVKLIEKQDPSGDLSTNEATTAGVVETARAFQAYLDATLKLRDALKLHAAAASANGRSSEKAAELFVADQDLLREVVSAEGLFGVARNEVEAKLTGAPKAALQAKKTELARLKKVAPPKPPVIHGLADGSSPANMKVFLRGNPATPGEESPRRLMEVISPPNAKTFSQGSGRLELALAIADPNNPLTARVIVNRIWAQHFGRGLVATPSNFGRMGERPSHPELLDRLASDLISSGWSLKGLHRTIMLSKTYQLSAGADSTNAAVDPENVYLWRANRRRLEVEAWRDAVLAVTGELDPALGGPSIDLKSSDNRRRTLYAAVSRHNLDGLLRLFDFPDPNLTSDKRVATTVPLQQLFVLNSPFMDRRAKALAARFTADGGESNDARIRRAFMLLFGRPATDREVQTSLAFLDDSDDHSAQDAAPSRWEQWAQALLATNEFAFVD
jgi:mono/diheme cytochrome c family protein